jgi:hypothetical protein
MGASREAVLSGEPTSASLSGLLPRSPSDGTHVTISPLERLLGVEEDGQITGIKAGPDMNGLVELLRHACLVFILSAEVCAEVNGLGGVAAALERAVVEFNALDGGVLSLPQKW